MRSTCPRYGHKSILIAHFYQISYILLYIESFNKPLFQPSLSMPRDFYTLPQFVDKLNGRAKQIETMMLYFAEDVLPDPKPYYDKIKQVGTSSTR